MLCENIFRVLEPELNIFYENRIYVTIFEVTLYKIFDNHRKKAFSTKATVTGHISYKGYYLEATLMIPTFLDATLF